MMDNKITRAQEIESLVVEGGLADYSLDSYDVEFENVSFNYDDLKDVLTDISFTAKQGEVTALVGRLAEVKVQFQSLPQDFGILYQVQYHLEVRIYQNWTQKSFWKTFQLFFRM